MTEAIIVLDDDESVCEYWERQCQRSNLYIQTFQRPADLFASIDQFKTSSNVFIDKNIYGKAIGLKISRRLYFAGYKNLYLSTAEDLKCQPALNWIKGFIGKTPPEWLFTNALTTPLSLMERTHLISQMSPQQLEVYKKRMEQFLCVVHGMDTGAFAGYSIDGFTLPETVIHTWERGITMSLNDDQIKMATDHAWLFC